jgi:Na+/glutamate symporter
MAVPKALAKRLRGRSVASNTFLAAASATAGLLAAVVIDDQ